MNIVCYIHNHIYSSVIGYRGAVGACLLVLGLGGTMGFLGLFV